MKKFVGVLIVLALLIFGFTALSPSQRKTVASNETERTGNGVADIVEAYKEQKEERAEEAEEAAHSGEDEIFEIATAEELEEFRDKVNGGTVALNAVLTADIDLSEVCGPEIGSWEPINMYEGTFDGNGHTINGLYISAVGSESYSFGLFGSAEMDSLIENLTLTNVDITAIRGVGGIVGGSSGTIKNCHVSGKVIGDTVGGVAGWADYIEDCSNEATVSNPDPFTRDQDDWVDFHAGGVAGRVGYLMKNCHNTANVTGNGGYIGGVAGMMGRSLYKITNIQRYSCEAYDCYNTGNVSGNYAGGVMGYCADAFINRCWNTGDVEGCGRAGGVVGLVSGWSTGWSFLENCFNKGAVTVKEPGEVAIYMFGSDTDGYGAGITTHTESCTVYNCYNQGKLTLCTEGGRLYSIMSGAHNSYGVNDMIWEGTSGEPDSNWSEDRTGSGSYCMISVGGNIEPEVKILGDLEASQFTDGTLLALLNEPENEEIEELRAQANDHFSFTIAEKDEWVEGENGPCFAWE